MATGAKFSVKALREMDREVLNKAEWTEAELTALRNAAADANTAVESATMSAVAQQSAAAYVLDRLGKFQATGEKAAYGQKIGKSVTRVGDYVLYGYAAVKHDIGFDTPLFEKLKQGGSGGHRAKIQAMLAKDEIDLAAFEALLDEAIAEEKRKAEKRKQDRADAQAKREADPLGGKEHTPQNLIVALEGILMAVGEQAGKFSPEQCATIANVADQLVGIAAVPMETQDVEQAA